MSLRGWMVFVAVTVASYAQSGEWMAMGKGGKVEPAVGGIVFTYSIQPKQTSVPVLPAPPELAHMQRLRFRIKSSADTSFAVHLSEKKPGGGNYTTVFWSPADTWQQIELTPADFTASDGPGDPVDTNARLDLDAVEGIGIIDLAQMFAALPEDAPMAIDRVSGARSMQIADFAIVTGVAARKATIDGFDRGFLEWITMGAMKLQFAPRDSPIQGAAMQGTVADTGGKYAVMIRRVSTMNLSGATLLTFDVATQNATTLIVSVEQKNGQRFNLTVYPPGKREVLHARLSLAEFEGDGGFDPGQWKSITIADSLGKANTIWVGKMAVE